MPASPLPQEEEFLGEACEVWVYLGGKPLSGKSAFGRPQGLGADGDPKMFTSGNFRKICPASALLAFQQPQLISVRVPISCYKPSALWH